MLSVLSYLCKAPLVPAGAPVVNALFKQRACIENLLRACLGLAPSHNMGLEHKLSDPTAWRPLQKLPGGLGVKTSNIVGKNGRGSVENGLGSNGSNGSEDAANAASEAVAAVNGNGKAAH